MSVLRWTTGHRECVRPTTARQSATIRVEARRMTPARDTLQGSIPTAGQTAFGPAVLSKFITRRPQKDWNLWETAQIDGNPPKIQLNPSAQALQPRAIQPNVKQARLSNPHRRS
jgi:hypothetical protein